MTWTPERRAAQAERLRELKPWLSSTGPRTPEGKKRSSLNGCRRIGRTEKEPEQSRPAVAPMLETTYPRMLYFGAGQFTDSAPLNAALASGKIKSTIVADREQEAIRRAQGWKDLAEFFA